MRRSQVKFPATRVVFIQILLLSMLFQVNTMQWLLGCVAKIQNRKSPKSIS